MHVTNAYFSRKNNKLQKMPQSSSTEPMNVLVLHGKRTLADVTK